MTRLEFVEVNDSVGEPQIISMENDLGLSLPESYKSFILEHNGGLPARCLFDIPGRGQSSVVFYGIQTDEAHNDLSKAFFAYKDRLPEDTLPIGFDPGGNLVCLVLGGEEEGKIYFWDHEVENTPPSLEKMWCLANSFEAFLRSLQYEDNEVW